MAQNKSPAFQFYPADFLSDAKTASMNAEEIGIYTLLLCYCWLEGSLPAEQNFLARLARTQQKKFTRLFSGKISACFLFDETTNTYKHPRLEKEREKQETYRLQQSEKGKRSAQQRFNHGSTTVQPESKSSSSSSSITTVTSKEKDKKEKTAQASLLPIPEKIKPTKLNFGEEGKVLLTAEEHQKLQAQLGAEKLESCIRLLNDFIGSKKKDPYASHYHAIKKWVVDAVEAKKGNPRTGTGQLKPTAAIVNSMASDFAMQNFLNRGE